MYQVLNRRTVKINGIYHTAFILYEYDDLTDDYRLVSSFSINGTDYPDCFLISAAMQQLEENV